MLFGVPSPSSRAIYMVPPWIAQKHPGKRSMKILFLTPYLPGPPVFGGQRRIHGLMTALSASHEVSVLSLVDGAANSREGIADAKKYCRRVVTVPDHLHRVSGKLKRVLQLGSVATRSSWERSLYVRPAFQRALDHHLSEHDYDVIVCEFVFMAGYDFGSVRAKRACLVLDEHNVEYDILERTASATGLFRRFFNATNCRKLKREEIESWQRFDGTLLTSARDEGIVRRQAPNARTAVVPNGVDVDSFHPDPQDRAAPMTLLFFGAINYFPNTDGVLFFLTQVFPLLRAKYPSVRARIVGPGAPESVVALGGDGVEIVGFVDDLRSEIAQASVVVAPLRIGGGTRLKILEALSVGKAVVSTTVGAEGLDVQHDRDILIADSPEAFASAVGRALDDVTLRERLGRAARRTAEALYSWKASARKLDAFLGELLASCAYERAREPSPNGS
jgi:glycosyltransferase involved in cell wall biosynthesis